ncbi:MAG: hypothetical protein SGCHY_001136 [Lobulomycetales sp.]
MVAYLSASVDPETGKPWCGDCRKAEPVVRDAVPDGFPFQFHHIATRQEWKVDPGQEHPFRKIASALPCLLRYEDGKVKINVVEEECWNPKVLEKVFQ